MSLADFIKGAFPRTFAQVRALQIRHRGSIGKIEMSTTGVRFDKVPMRAYLAGLVVETRLENAVSRKQWRDNQS